MKSMKKLVGSALLASGVCAASIAAVPQNAMALGWEPESMVAQTTGTTGMTAANINQQSLATWVQNFTTFLLGIAIVIFVLKIVLTAVDKMLLKGPSSGSGSPSPSSSKGGGSNIFDLTKIPIIGAYSGEWGDIFKHFGIQVAVVAGAWVLVQIVVGVILFVFGTLTSTVS